MASVTTRLGDLRRWSSATERSHTQSAPGSFTLAATRSRSQAAPASPNAGDGAGLELAIALDADNARDRGTDAPLGDELHVGVAVRLGRNHRYWSTANAGAGPYVGICWTKRSVER